MIHKLTGIAPTVQKKIYAMRRMRQAIMRALSATSGANKGRADRWVVAWGCVADLLPCRSRRRLPG
jgi:hypothetical protein